MELRAQVLRVEKYIESIALPESQDLINKSPPIQEWNAKQRSRLAMALEDNNEALLQEALGALVKAQERVNTLVAEEFRQLHPDPAEWPLGHFKWMRGVQYIHFTSPLGDFLLYPQRPRFPKQGHRWYTADELIDIYSSPAIIESIKLFQVLPSRAELVLSRPPPGETDLHVDFTVSPTTTRAVRGLAGRRY